MKVSIIIPVYNQKERLKLVLKGFNMQSYKDWYEVIVIDDGSTDNFDENLNNIKYKYQFTYKKLNKNSGRSIARNIGAKLAKGNLLIFNDADRIPCTNFIQEHVNAHNNNITNTIVIGKVVELFINDFEKNFEKLYKFNKISDLTKNIRNFNYYDFIEEMYDIEGNTNCIIAWISLFSGNFSILNETYFNLGGFNENFITWGFENFEFGYRLCKMGVNYILNRKAINYHIFHKSDRVGHRRDEAYNIFLNLHPYPEVKRILELLDGNISWRNLEMVSKRC